LMVSSDRRYSQQARRSLIWARLLAQEYCHMTVESDHVLLGIWRTESSVGYQVLNAFQVERSHAEDTVRDLHPRLDVPIIPTPFSNDLKTILSYAADEAYWLGHHYIGTEHILLGLVRGGTGQLSNLLLRLDVSSHLLRQRIRHLLGEGIYESKLEAMRQSARLSELSRRVLNAAARQAEEHKHASVGLEHLLLVLSQERRSMATRLLVETGLSQKRLSEDIKRLQVDSVMAATALDAVLIRAVEQTEVLGMHYTGTNHILLAMLMDEEGAALMKAYGINLSQLKEKLQATFNQ
jgi:ATP-dependent Clp protease ATP-binding subunit ClpC